MDSGHEPEEVRVLETLRARAVALALQLEKTIAKIQNGHEPLPPWSSVQASMTELSRSVRNIQETMTDNERSIENPLKTPNLEFLRSAHVRPLPNYPGGQQYGVLQDLLKKKLDFEVENWFAGNAVKAESLQHDPTALKSRDLRELWSWAPIEANQLAQKAIGLAGDSDEEDESGEDEDEDDKMEDVQIGGAGGAHDQQGRRTSLFDDDPDNHARRPMELRQILPFMLTGMLGFAAQEREEVVQGRQLRAAREKDERARRLQQGGGLI